MSPVLAPLLFLVRAVAGVAGRVLTERYGLEVRALGGLAKDVARDLTGIVLVIGAAPEPFVLPPPPLSASLRPLVLLLTL